MESREQNELRGEVDAISKQIEALKQTKEVYQQKLNSFLPSAFDALTSKKRDRDTLLKADIQKVKELLKKDGIINRKALARENKNAESDATESDSSLSEKVIQKGHFYSKETKMLIYDFVQQYGRQAITSATNIPSETIRTFEKTVAKKGSFGLKRGRKERHPEFQAEISLWITQNRLKNKKVTARQVIREAKKQALEHEIEDLRFSYGWFRKFLDRNKFSLRRPHTQVMKTNASLLTLSQTFIAEIQELLQSSVYDQDFVINMDETSVSSESSNSKTVDIQGGKRVRVSSTGKQKECTTVLLAGSMTGRKLNCMVILPDKGVKKLKRVVPENVQVYHREKGSWIDREGMKYWNSNVLARYARKIPHGKRGLLLIDNCPGHVSEELESIINELRIDVKKIPPNTTALCQPMDMTVNRAFKQYFSHSWED